MVEQSSTVMPHCIDNVNDDVYSYIVIIGMAAWGLCFVVNLPLLIVYWVMYRKRVAASDKYIDYKFSEQREIIKVPTLNSPSTVSPTTVVSNVLPMSPGISRDDPFLTSPSVTYRPPTFIADQGDRWQRAK